MVALDDDDNDGAVELSSKAVILLAVADNDILDVLSVVGRIDKADENRNAEWYTLVVSSITPIIVAETATEEVAPKRPFLRGIVALSKQVFSQRW